MSLVVIVPVLGRPQNVDPLCDSIAASTPPCRILFVADPDDTPEIEAIERRQASEQHNHIGLLRPGGSYGHKINRGIAATLEPLVFTAADDLDFKPGWFEAANKRLRGRIGVVGTQDLGHRWIRAGKHAAHFLLTRKYVERQGTIDERGKAFHEGYNHVCCDIELVETAKSRGMWAFARNSIVEHLHPFWGKGEMDDTYRLAYDKERRAHDRTLLKKRRPLWASAS